MDRIVNARGLHDLFECAGPPPGTRQIRPGAALEYDQNFVKDFMKRTLAIADSATPYEATLLMNCLLGLLIVPNEKLMERIPTESLASLKDWGVHRGSVISAKCEYGHDHELTLRQLVRRLRNAVAHFRIEPVHENGVVKAFAFRDGNNSKFQAEISGYPDLSVFQATGPSVVRGQQSRTLLLV